MTSEVTSPLMDTDPDAGPQTPHRRRMRLWLALGAAVATVAGGSWFAAQGSPRAPADASGNGRATAQVTRETLADTRRFAGTLGHGEAMTVAAAAQGVVTGIAGQGSGVARGTELYRVNEQPVTALYGEVPMYRDLRSGNSGADVVQLEANLAELGYTGFTIDDQFTSATAAAVRRWQADLGRPETGVVAQADVVFVPEGSRVDALHTRIGHAVSQGTAVLDLTSSDHVVTLDIEVRNRDLLRVGTDVTAKLPSGEEVPATVTAARAVPAESGDTTIQVDVTLGERVDESLLGGFADVLIEVDERADVLAVPVNALLALAAGGHGLEVVADDGTTTLVEVDTGLFAGGKVEVSGDGIVDGTVVVVAGR